MEQGLLGGGLRTVSDSNSPTCGSQEPTAELPVPQECPVLAEPPSGTAPEASTQAVIFVCFFVSVLYRHFFFFLVLGDLIIIWGQLLK